MRGAIIVVVAGLALAVLSQNANAQSRGTVPGGTFPGARGPVKLNPTFADIINGIVNQMAAQEENNSSQTSTGLPSRSMWSPFAQGTIIWEDSQTVTVSANSPVPTNLASTVLNNGGVPEATTLGNQDTVAAGTSQPTPVVVTAPPFYGPLQSPDSGSETSNNGSGSDPQSSVDVQDGTGVLASLVTDDAADTMISSNGFESFEIVAIYVDFSSTDPADSALAPGNLQVNYPGSSAQPPSAGLASTTTQPGLANTVPSLQVPMPSSQIAMPSSQVQTPSDVMTSLDLQPALCGR